MPKKSTSSRSRSSGSSTTTVDHEEIRQWAESRGGKPACVKGTGGGGDTGVLRIEFRDDDEESLHDIDWDEFFEKFDEQNLALVYQDKTSGGETSRFSKLVSRDNVGAKGGGGAASRSSGRGGSRGKSSRRPGTQNAKSAGAKSKGGRSPSRASANRDGGSSNNRRKSKTSATSGSSRSAKR